MTPLEVILIVSGGMIVFLTLFAFRREKIALIPAWVFFGVGILLIILTLFPGLLNRIGAFVGLQRGADFLVYVSIIFLLYGVFFLLQKVEKQRQDLSKLIQNLAIQHAKRPKK